MDAVTLGEPVRASSRDGGSFRDPSGYVFHRSGAIYRALSETAYSDFIELERSGLLAELQKSQLVVGTRLVDDPALAATLAAENPGYQHFIEHDRISPITYPYEWTISMLGDAGVHTLAVQRALLKGGWSLKDATAYNIQFVNGRPIFIDITSIERPPRLDVWYALGQFTQMFLFPLLLMRYHGWDLRSYFIGNIGGRDVAAVARSLGFFERWGPRGLVDVTLPNMFEASGNKSTAKAEGALKKSNRSADVQLVNLGRLERKIRKLVDGYRASGHWVVVRHDLQLQRRCRQRQAGARGGNARGRPPQAGPRCRLQHRRIHAHLARAGRRGHLRGRRPRCRGRSLSPAPQRASRDHPDGRESYRAQPGDRLHESRAVHVRRPRPAGLHHRARAPASPLHHRQPEPRSGGRDVCGG